MQLTTNKQVTVPAGTRVKAVVYLKKAALYPRAERVGHGSTQEQAPGRPTWAVPVPADECLLDPLHPAKASQKAAWLSYLMPLNRPECGNEILSPGDGLAARCRRAGFLSLLGGLLGSGQL